jgi:RND family efflux transporter MFP subunit
MSRLHRLSPLGALAALSLIALAAGCRPPAPPPQMPPPPVSVAPPEQRELTDQEELSTRLEAVESVEIRPRVSGYLTEIRFQAGQLVKQGDILFRIDPRPFEAALQRAEADLAQARVRSEWNTRDAERAADLLREKTISTEEADQRTTRSQEARAALASAQASVATAQLNLDYATIRSPISGRVSRALVTVGNNISGVDGFNTLLTTVVSVDPIHGYSNLDEGNLLRLQAQRAQPGLPTNAAGQLTVTLSLPGAPHLSRTGAVESFDNRVDPATGSLLLRTVFPNPDGSLLPGLYGRVTLPTSGRRAVLLVPESALGTDQSQRFVLVLGTNQTAEYRAVKPGAAFEGKRIIREGLRADDLVLVNGAGLARVRPGAPVQAQREGATNAAPSTRP